MFKFASSIALTLSLIAQSLSAQTEPASLEDSAMNLSLMEMILSVGWGVLVPLALLSILIITLVVFNIFWLRTSNLCTAGFLSEARALLKERKLEALLSLCSENKSMACARVLNRMVSFARANPGVSLEGLKEVAEAEAGRLASRINQPNLLLMDFGVLGPLVGLLGTVIGILRSFGHIAADATPMKTMLLAGGVSQALAATAIGLVIGLAAMFFYALFRPRVQYLVNFFQATLTELMVKTHECLAHSKSATPQPKPSPES
ncbi:MAG: MotA/TolQ/ExbB proton channel family protein [Verrucomicrobiota bacterium]